MRNTLITLLFAASLFLPHQLWAWGDNGHRIVGEIAMQQLNKKTEKKVRKLLGGADLAMECTWGDFIKSDTTIGKFNDWHYCDFDSGLSREAYNALAMNNPHGQCIYRIHWLVKHLQEQPNDTNMLKMLIHIVGDLGCPMHLGRPSDRGGNDLTCKWFGRNANIHSVWDTQLIAQLKISYTEFANHIIKTHSSPKMSYHEGLEIEWGWETYQLTEKIYAYSTEGEGKSGDLRYKYVYDFLQPLQQQLFITGCHLAAILNYIYR